MTRLASHTGDSPEGFSAAARAAYVDFLARELAGEPADFDALCRQRPQLERELRQMREQRDDSTSAAVQVDPAARTGPEAAAHPGDGLAELLRRIRQPLPRAARYRQGDELGRGGMGAVYRVWDEELARSLAMKVLHTGAGDAEDGQAYVERLRRFLNEAQITSQLDHPGIVPVHELGFDPRGRPYFTMKLVQGRDLAQIFALAWKGAEGWSTTRAVGAVLKVCEAMAYAHQKGVVHRDLKPANVMVGRFGEVFVMDWGVARVLAGAAGTESARRSSGVQLTGRADSSDAALTAEGDVIGTAVYMAPEQARGELRNIDARTDVYAVGALLYHLLAERPPYLRDGPRASTAQVLGRLLAGPPEPLARIAPDAPPELASICEQAMARDVEQRYASMLELGDDLRAWLEGRVVRAHERGALAELKKWVLRNKGLAGASAVAVVCLVGGLGAFSYSQAQRRIQAEASNRRISEEKARADDNAAFAEREAERARVESRTSDRVTRFLTEVFKDQRPDRRSRELSAREVLDQAAVQVHSELADEPATRLRVLESLASAYMSLGHLKEAEPLLQEARDIAAALHGELDDRTLELERWLANLDLMWRRFERSRQRFAALQACYEQLGRGAEEPAFEARLGIARCLAEELSSIESERTLLELVRDAKAALGPRSVFVHKAERALAFTYYLAGQLDEAKDVLERSLAEGFDAQPRANEVEASLRSLAAELQRASLDPLGAEPAVREHFEREQAQWGPDDTRSLDALHALAVNLRQQARWAEARELYQSVHAGRLALLGARHAQTLAAAIDLADMCLVLGEFDRAHELAAEALELLRDTTSGFNLSISNALRVLARTAAEAGRVVEAERYARERLDGLAADDPRRADRERFMAEIRALAQARSE